MTEKRPRNSILQMMDKTGQVIENISGYFCVFLFAAMTVVTLVGVLFRYVMTSPFEWTEEVARFLMLTICFMAMNMAMRRKEHIAITSAVDKMPAGLSKFLGYIADIQIAFFLILLIKQGYLMSMRTLMTASTFHLSMKWIYMFVPLGALLTLIQLIILTTQKIFTEFEPKTEKIG